MADKKISQLSGASTPLAGTEVLPIVQSGSTVKVSVDDLTVKNIRSNATTGILQIAGPAAAATRTMTVPDANFTAARTDAAQTFTGAQTFSSDPVFNGGTANGVLYLNASKAATSGSALTFDGTNFAVGSQGEVRVYNTANTRYGRFVTTGDGTVVESFNGAGEPLILSAPQSSGYVGVKVNNVEQARFNTTGLGIGTTPGTKLDVATSSGDCIVRVGNGTSQARYAVDSDGPYIYALTSGDNALRVFTPAGSQAMTLNSSGSLLLGTTTSRGLITTSGSGNQNIYFTHNDSASGREVAIRLTNNNDDYYNYGVFIKGVQGSGIDNYSLTFGTSSAAAGASVERARITSDGEFYIAGTSDQGAYNLQVNGTGVWGAGAYVNGSDSRIKEDIAPIASGLDVVEKLNPVTYRYKEDWSKDQSVQTGFIAQELLTALDGQVYVDGVVQQGGAEGYYSVAYQNIIPILTKAIQELKAELDATKVKVAALESK